MDMTTLSATSLVVVGATQFVLQYFLN